MNLVTKDCNFTAVDFETANWYRKSACSIGMVKVENGVIVDEFYSLIKPTPFLFQYMNVKLHGIDHLMCQNAPTFGELWPTIKPWIDGQIIIAHNVSFEKSVLHHLFDCNSINAKVKDYLCTLYMSQVYLHHLQSHKLSNVYSALFNKKINHHHALEDAKACAEIAIYVADNWKIPNFSKMVAALYDTPVEDRISRKPASLAQLAKDPGFEDNVSFKGMNYTFTGDLEGFTREEAGQFVVNRGGKANDGVTRSTTHLVVGSYDPLYGEEHKSGKFKKALELNAKGSAIVIMSGKDFLKLTNEKTDDTIVIEQQDISLFSKKAV